MQNTVILRTNATRWHGIVIRSHECKRNDGLLITHASSIPESGLVHFRYLIDNATLCDFSFLYCFPFHISIIGKQCSQNNSKELKLNISCTKNKIYFATIVSKSALTNIKMNVEYTNIHPIDNNPHRKYRAPNETALMASYKQKFHFIRNQEVKIISFSQRNKMTHNYQPWYFIKLLDNVKQIEN